MARIVCETQHSILMEINNMHCKAQHVLAMLLCTALYVSHTNADVSGKVVKVTDGDRRLRQFSENCVVRQSLSSPPVVRSKICDSLSLQAFQ